MSDSEQPKPKSDFSGLKDDSAPDVQAAYEAAHAELPQDSAANDRVARKRRGPFEETAPTPINRPAKKLKNATRRDFLFFGMATAAAATLFWDALPQETQTFHLRDDPEPGDVPQVKPLPDINPKSRKEVLLNKSLTFDDDVAEALYSPTRLVPTYAKSKITPLRNNYNGQTPDPGYLDDWTLTIAGAGLAGGKDVVLDAHELRSTFAHHEQVTRLVCVEGWSAIAWWGGLRFCDLLAKYPPKPCYVWASLQSDVNLDDQGNSDPYYVSIDLPTARHPQTLLATHYDGKLLGVDHGAPLRLIAPMKLGLKNIKAITSVTYSKTRPDDYWADRGYSHYDGI